MRTASSAAERKEAAAELGRTSSKPRRRRMQKPATEDQVHDVGGSAEHAEASSDGANGMDIDTEA